jgi:hypothetical protein
VGASVGVFHVIQICSLLALGCLVNKSSQSTGCHAKGQR